MEKIVVTSYREKTQDKIKRWIEGDGDVASYVGGQLTNWAKRYLKEAAGDKCTECGWGIPNPTLGRTILTIDHIDGNWTNNRYDNLKVLCFNCHTLTSSFGSLNVGNSPRSRPGLPQKVREGYYVREVPEAVIKTCAETECGATISNRSTRCRVHAPRASVRKSKIVWPSDEALIDGIRRSNFYALGKALGVSDNAIRKRLKNRGYDIKTLAKIN